MKRVLQFMIKVQEVLAMSGIAVFTLAIFLGAVTRIFRHPLNILSTIALFAFYKSAKAALGTTATTLRDWTRMQFFRQNTPITTTPCIQ